MGVAAHPHPGSDESGKPGGDYVDDLPAGRLRHKLAAKTTVGLHA